MHLIYFCNKICSFLLFFFPQCLAWHGSAKTMIAVLNELGTMQIDSKTKNYESQQAFCTDSIFFNILSMEIITLYSSNKTKLPHRSSYTFWHSLIVKLWLIWIIATEFRTENNWHISMERTNLNYWYFNERGLKLLIFCRKKFIFSIKSLK